MLKAQWRGDACQSHVKQGTLSGISSEYRRRVDDVTHKSGLAVT